MTDPRRKGISGEREILETIVYAMIEVEGMLADHKPRLYSNLVKRNSLQSDRGGFDIAGVPLLAIEVKRQEKITLESWWQQCVASAKLGEMPVLFYRQNRRPWRCVTYVALARLDGSAVRWTRAEFDADDFVKYYKTIYLEFQLKELGIVDLMSATHEFESSPA